MMGIEGIGRGYNGVREIEFASRISHDRFPAVKEAGFAFG
jgi:hypothetical protein